MGNTLLAILVFGGFILFIIFMFVRNSNKKASIREEIESYSNDELITELKHIRFMKSRIGGGLSTSPEASQHRYYEYKYFQIIKELKKRKLIDEQS